MNFRCHTHTGEANLHHLFFRQRPAQERDVIIKIRCDRSSAIHTRKHGCSCRRLSFDFEVFRSIVRFKSESSNFNPSYVEFSPRHDPFCSTDLNSMDKSTHVTFFLMRDSPWKMGFTTCASIFPPHLNPTRDHLPIQDSMFDFNELQRVVASHLLRIWRHANGESCALGRPRYDAASNAHELLSKMKSYCACIAFHPFARLGNPKFHEIFDTNLTLFFQG